MKSTAKYLNILLITFVLSIAVFGYLTSHHYSLKLGDFGPSVCQLSDKVNCDVAAQSSYSEVASIPIALFGLIYSVYMLVFLGAVRLGWVEDTSFKRSLTLTIFGFSLLASVALGFVTITELKTVCPFCVAGYILSIAQFGLGFAWVRQSKEGFNLFGGLETGFALSLIAIPFFSWIIAKNVSDKYGFEQIKSLTSEKVEVWKRAPEQAFDLNAGLIKGNPNGTKTIIEFGDFKCPHCKVAADTLGNFSKKYPDAKIIFKPFPLDGECNPAIGSRGDKSRCMMAAWTLCAEKTEQKGWLVHDWLFENQSRLFTLFGDELKNEFMEFATKSNLNFEEIALCGDTTDMMALISKIAEEGKAAGIQGTPTIFVNQRKLEAAQIFDVLSAAYNSL